MTIDCGHICLRALIVENDPFIRLLIRETPEAENGGAGFC